MTLTVTHSFVSTKPVGNDSTRIYSDSWNADHTLTGTSDANQLNANVVQAVVDDTNIQGTIANQTLTFAWAGLLVLARGGTNADLSATGGTSQVLFQETAGGPVTVRQLVLADLGFTSQYITSGSTVTVANTDSLIVINKGTGSATTVNLPASASKVGPVKIVDFKGDAGTNNITVNCAGSEKFNGGNAAWVIASDTASIICDPVVNSGTGMGYAV